MDMYFVSFLLSYLVTLRVLTGTTVFSVFSFTCSWLWSRDSMVLMPTDDLSSAGPLPVAGLRNLLIY